MRVEELIQDAQRYAGDTPLHRRLQKLADMMNGRPGCYEAWQVVDHWARYAAEQDRKLTEAQADNHELRNRVAELQLLLGMAEEALRDGDGDGDGQAQADAMRDEARREGWPEAVAP